MKSLSDKDFIFSEVLPYLCVTRVEARRWAMKASHRTPRSAHVLDPLHGLLLGIDT